MKKLALSLFFVASIGTAFFVSCHKNNDAQQKQEIVRTDPKILYGDLTPTTITVTKENIAFVGFIQSAAALKLNLNEANSDSYLKELETAKENRVPVRIEVYEGTNEIATIAASTKEVIESNRKMFSAESKIATKESLPIIPNETALNNLFSAVNISSIPYQYAADGCYARAHKMRQIIMQSGYDCAKLFVYGNLAANTGSCCVYWGWHVAPLVRYRNAAGVVDLAILDPSLFKKPVSQQEWLDKCKDYACNSGAIISSTYLAYGNVYIRDYSGGVMTDDNYSKTNCVISKYIYYSGCSAMPYHYCY